MSDERNRLERRRVPSHERGRHRRGIARGDRAASLRAASAVAILVIWGISTMLDIASAVYDPPQGLNTIALAAATYLFGSAFVKENKER